MILGVVAGVVAVELVSNDAVLIALWAGLGMTALATLIAGYFIMVASYTAGMTMTWAVQGSDVAALNTADRLLAEVVAFLLAIAAVALLHRWDHRRTAPAGLPAAT